MIHSFDPVIDQHSRILILGSMPGVESLKKKEYYGNPRNHFWKIIYSLFDCEVDSSYKEKIHFILEHQLALWDVLAHCDREGSLDIKIKNEVANDFDALFLQYPKIKYVLFNGAKAYESFRNHVGFQISADKNYHQLPSTSPANTIGLQAKLNEWQILRRLI